MKNNKLFFLFLLIFIFTQDVYAIPQIPTDLVNYNTVYDIFNFYYPKFETPLQIPINYTVLDDGTLATRNIVYKDIIIGNFMQTPIVINSKSEDLNVTVSLEKVYFLSNRSNFSVENNCSRAILRYYTELNNLFLSPYNPRNKDVVIDRIFVPRTKERIISFLSSNGVNNPEDCLFNLETNRNLYSFPVLFKLESKLIGTKESLGKNFSFQVKFNPDFLSNIKPIQYNVSFRKEPIRVSSTYSFPRGCENNPIVGACYITNQDIINFNETSITSPESVAINNEIYSLLNNFTAVSSFKNNMFENINTQNLLVDLSLKREQFCFREENEDYTKVIFDVAKAYDLSLEEAFQLWALISERSNCNYNLDPSLYGFAQVDLRDRADGKLIDIEEITNIQNNQIPVDSSCSMCGDGYFLSSNYPTRSASVGGQNLLKGQVCYKCVSNTRVERCNPNNGIVGGTVNMPLALKNEICPNFGNLPANQTNISNQISNTIPLQLEEEEQFQYLAIGDFNNINNYIRDNLYNGDTYAYYKYGIDNKITNSETYFNFLINAIKYNSDEYGSTILFASDYIKAMNFLVKNSREKSDNAFIFEDHILSTPYSLNSVYVLSNILNSENTEKIYEIGRNPNIFESTTFFVKDGNNIKTIRDIRVLINYLAIKRKYLRDPEYFLRFDLRRFNANTPDLTLKLENYNRLNHKYWDTKKNIYLETLETNNQKLMLKKNIEYYSFDRLLSIPARPNYPVSYILDFGKDVYLDGQDNYIGFGLLAWNFDTKREAIDNYNLIWEASNICNNKIVCDQSVPTTKDCCYENRSLQDGRTYYPYLDVLIDGAILGIYNPTSKYNDENREYTHLAMYIGKTSAGIPLIIESTVNGQKISILNREIRDRVKRIYVPKSTNIQNIRSIIQNPSRYPSTYVKLTNVQLQEIQRQERERIGDTSYYEDPDVLGEGDIDQEYARISAQLIERSVHYLGTPYVLGGRNGYTFGPTNYPLKGGLDCVGLQYVALRDLGYIDGSAGCKEMFENGCAVVDFIEKNKGHITGTIGILDNQDDLDLLRPGDLLFFNTKHGVFGHAAIYYATEPGCHKYIHAPQPGSNVRYECIESGINNNNTGNRRFPFQYARITSVNTSEIDCSGNYITASNRELKCCDATRFC